MYIELYDSLQNWQKNRIIFQIYIKGLEKNTLWKIHNAVDNFGKQGNAEITFATLMFIDK